MQKFLRRILNNAVSRSNGGFTMIELLIVITILGILATAVLSAINPIEQINRGRDTGSQSDAEQLLSAIERHNAFKGYYPWQADANDTVLSVGAANGLPDLITAALPVDHRTTAPCHVLNRLSNGTALSRSPCATEGTNELKASFVDRVVNNSSSRDLYLYNQGGTGDSTYVCFAPQSDAFQSVANERCKGTGTDYLTGGGMPSDMSDAAAAFLCGGTGAPVAAQAMTCLP